MSESEKPQWLKLIDQIFFSKNSVSFVSSLHYLIQALAFNSLIKHYCEKDWKKGLLFWPRSFSMKKYHLLFPCSHVSLCFTNGSLLTCVFMVNFEHIYIFISYLFADVDFEQVNISWVRTFQFINETFD